MRRCSRTIFGILRILALSCLLLTSNGHAREIISTATARWTLEGQSFENSSNIVTLPLAASGVALRTYYPIPGGTSLPVTPALCNSTGPALPGSTPPDLITLRPTSSVHVGENLIIEIVSTRHNTNPAEVDGIEVKLSSINSADRTVTVQETGPDTGIFRSLIQTQPKAAAQQSNCKLSIEGGDILQLSYLDRAGRSVSLGSVDVLVDPFGVVIDSQDGRAISGARVSLVDVNGQPAAVFGPDGTTAWPSTIISGQSVIDGAGTQHTMQEGEYRFPFVAQGTYTLIVDPPDPYTSPSTLPLSHFAELRRPGDHPLAISDASFGRPFTLSGPDPLRVDIPVDRATILPTLTKTASKDVVQPGDAIIYTVSVSNTDTIAEQRVVVLEDKAMPGLRLVADSIRINGIAPNPDAVFAFPDGTGFRLQLGKIAPSAQKKITYAMRVRDNAAPGPMENVITLTDSRGIRKSATATVRVERDIISARMTIIGRITTGQCERPDRRGLANVRVMLEDGSYAITDADGRYHFEGVIPGTHVVQLAPQSLPKGSTASRCMDSVRAAGNATSRFVTGQGGSLAVADFVIKPAKPDLKLIPPEDTSEQDALNREKQGLLYKQKSAERQKNADPDYQAKRAAGAETDWFAAGDGPDEFLFPAPKHNPRAPAVRVVIRHRPNTKVTLKVGDTAISDLSFDGNTLSNDGRYAISIWRGIPLVQGANVIRAEIRDSRKEVEKKIERTINFSGPPAHAEFVKERSQLIADGRTTPVIAVRLTDRNGNPVRHGLAGDFTLNAPYESSSTLEAIKQRQLTRSGDSTPHWTINGDDGIALIKLSPTMVSGALRLGFNFTDGDMKRQQKITEWIAPGDQPWTLIALAEGATGSTTINGQIAELDATDKDAARDKRIAFYAKGKVLGKFLFTTAYDSAKQKTDQELLGIIDPNTYYTVFGDNSHRKSDAASREKLYVRIESAAFSAIYGDFVTGFDKTDLASYQRTATGLRGEISNGKWHAEAFAAETSSQQKRDEIQGNGLSGPYRLSSRGMIPNSERVAIEVRDRFRSEIIVNRRDMTRFVDYDIDRLSGTISFREPILSRDTDLNAQFIVIDYTVDDASGKSELNAGIRTDYTMLDGALVVGTTAITDESNNEQGRLAALDLTARINADTEIRAELAESHTGSTQAASWQIETEHHSGNWDTIAYVRNIADDFGISQQNLGEKGHQKVGVDSRYTVNEKLSFTGSTWTDESLIDASRRNSVQLSGTARTDENDLRLGISHFADQLGDGTKQSSTVLDGTITRRLMEDKLELALSSSLALGSAESADLPARHQLTARYALNQATRLLANYEISEAANQRTQTVSAGIETTPWTGGRVISSVGESRTGERGLLTFAAAGLTQSVQVSPELALNFSLESRRKLRGRTLLAVSLSQPTRLRGSTSDTSVLFEDFTALSLGGTWRNDQWSASGRGEWRDGDLANRQGLTLSLIRQLGNGSVLGSGLTWTQSNGDGLSDAGTSEVLDAAIAAAYRPEQSSLAFLAKMEYRADSVTGAFEGETPTAGRSALTLSESGQMRRLIGSLSGNLSPKGVSEASGISELALFLSLRHSLDQVEGYSLNGTSYVVGMDARYGLSKYLELGLSTTMRANLNDDTTSYAVGPSIGLSPMKDALITFGYNFSGFTDPDYTQLRSTNEGAFANIRLKVDQDSFGFLRRNGS